MNAIMRALKTSNSPWAAPLRRAAKRALRAEVPYIRGVHDFLYRAHMSAILGRRQVARAAYFQPLFRSRCASCGPGLSIVNSGQGMPWIIGDIDIHLGRDVSIHDKTTIVGLTHGLDPTLQIMDRTDISRPVSFFVGRRIEIGRECMIGCVLISDNPGHRLHYKDRVSLPVDPAQIGRVEIGDHVWAGIGSFIVGNVRVGAGAVIGAGCIVTRDVPPFCVAVGNPARVVKKLGIPEEKRESLDEEMIALYERTPAPSNTRG